MARANFFPRMLSRLNNRGARRKAAARNTAAKLKVEQLEDRLTPTSIVSGEFGWAIGIGA